MENNEVAIIGMGPSGVSAAIYLKRYGMVSICFEKELVGGKVNKTEKIENYVGFSSIGGIQLGEKLDEQLSHFNINVNYSEVKSLSLNDDKSFHIVYGKKERDFKYVILANGMGEKPFHIDGEELFNKRGISRCAICDGSFYKGKDVAVIGAGNSAFEEGIYLSNICKSVTLIARRTQFRADKIVVDKFNSLTNTIIKAPYVPTHVDGTNSIESITLLNTLTNESKTIKIAGLFLYVGDQANTSFVKIPNILDDKGIVLTDDNLMTKVNNLYAIGDCRDTTLRQVATAVSDGAVAASNIFKSYKEN